MSEAVENAGLSQNKKDKKNNLIFPIVIFSFMVLFVVFLKKKNANENMPVLYKVPAFSLLNQNGKVITDKNFSENFYLANFFFTSCSTICMELFEKLKVLQTNIAENNLNLKIVSITVDPETDTPNVLKKRADSMEINSDHWHLLTGEFENIKHLLLNGFKVPLGEKMEVAKDVWDIAHSGKLVLVDLEGNIRGFYDSTEDVLKNYNRLK